ncbi:MAG: DNA-3-methyladenine glycosylase [Kineosporiaceae bacterium]|nr:DNA-3-methyladenine glycosylase [Aeromicrobium sp.]
MTDEYPVGSLLEFARSLLGSRIVSGDVAVRLTEVEAYAGPLDPASHAYNRTPRSEIMFGPPMRLYVYFSYGIHWCANIVWGEEGTACAVLMRAGQVVSGLDEARRRRGAAVPEKRLASGPANLTKALGIGGTDNGADLSDAEGIHLELRTDPAPIIVAGPRVGVSKAADVPWRFWIAGDRSVSAYKRSPRAPAPSD